LVSANGKVSWRMASGTDIGLLRTRNEDSLRIFPKFGVAILSDGMGGLHAGDLASKLAVESVVADLGVSKSSESQDSLRSTVDPKLLTNALQRANTAIRGAPQWESDNHRMGATIIVVVFQESQFIAAHLGDSRLYRFSNDRLDRLTSDHTLAEQYREAGLRTPEQVRRGWKKNVLIRALGIDEKVIPDVTEGPVDGNDLFLLCSDGLTDAVAELDIERLLKKDHEHLQYMVDELIALANHNGGPDNISVILARASSREI